LADGVVYEAYGAGLRYWLLQIYHFAGVPAVDTAEDLRWWCKLIFKVPQVAEAAKIGLAWERNVPLPGCDEDQPFGFVEDLDDHGLLSELVESFPDEVLDPQFMGEFNFARWERIDYSTAAFHDVPPPPVLDVFLTPERCQSIVDQAWDHLRPLALPLVHPYPPQPAHVSDARGLKIALDQVMNWACEEIRRQPGLLPTIGVRSGKRGASVRSNAQAATAGPESRQRRLFEAIGLLSVVGPDLRKIAETMGVGRTTLYGWDEFMKHYEPLKEELKARRRRRHRGYRTRDRHLEAFTDED
jgi:hypothetical protein